MSQNLVPYYDLRTVDNANLAASTKAQYRKALLNYLQTGSTLGDTNALAEYARTLKPSSRAFLKAAIRLVSAEFATALKAGATPENVTTVQASLYRLEALDEIIRVASPKGEMAHTWLSQAEVKRLTSTCENDIVGRRDWIVLGLLVGAGLRREELAELTFETLASLPRRNGAGVRYVLNVTGKGAKARTIPIKHILAERLLAWREEVGGGKVARSLGRKRELGETLSAIAVFAIVRRHGAAIGKPDLAPHDLRRTYAQLGYEAGVPVTQISRLLGHANIATTQRYLNLDLDIESTVSDFIPLE